MPVKRSLPSFPSQYLLHRGSALARSALNLCMSLYLEGPRSVYTRTPRKNTSQTFKPMKSETIVYLHILRQPNRNVDPCMYKPHPSMKTLEVYRVVRVYMYNYYEGGGRDSYLPGRHNRSCYCKSLSSFGDRSTIQEFDVRAIAPQESPLEGFGTILSHPHRLPENHCNIFAEISPEWEMPKHSPSRLLKYEAMSKSREDPAQKRCPAGPRTRQ